MAVPESIRPKLTSPTVAPGIRAHGRRLQARVHVSGRSAYKAFPSSTPLAEIQRWREITRGDLLKDGRYSDTEAEYYRTRPLPLIDVPPPSADVSRCYLYFIQSGGYVKVGVARNIQARLADLQTANPEPLRLVGALLCSRAPVAEAAIHRRFLERRVNGEWFELSHRLMWFIADIRNGIVLESDLAESTIGPYVAPGPTQHPAGYFE